MKDRTRNWLFVIIMLTLVALWIDLPFYHPQWVNSLLLWQSPEAKSYNRKSGDDPLRIRYGLDLQGGLQVMLRADPPQQIEGVEGAEETSELPEGSLEAIRKIVENRVNGMGVAEALVQTQGTRRIIVELPGIDDPDLAISTIKETGLLEFIDAGELFLPAGTEVQTSYRRESQDTGATDTITSTGQITGAEAISPSIIFKTVFTGRDLKNANMIYNQQESQYQVAFEMRGDAAAAFEQYTSLHIGQVMAIVLDGRVISSPVIRSAIPGGSGVIEGDFTYSEARSLAVQLQYGALPVPLTVETQRSVGATLGQESVDKSIQAGLIGLSVVLLFMLIYYRLPGALADVALIIYALFNMALFRLVPVTLTLPGIAGFLLSTGMAVDANILIFERMKEELRRGRTLHAAIEAGFDRAWTSIRDSNLSTIITCAILYWFGSNFGASVVKGFALTLFIGVMVSMFTAVIVTRTFLRLVFRVMGDRLEERKTWLGV